MNEPSSVENQTPATDKLERTVAASKQIEKTPQTVKGQLAELVRALGNHDPSSRDFLLRVVQPNENVRMAVGEIYDIQALTRDFRPITVERLKDALGNAGPKDALKKVLNASLASLSRVRRASGHGRRRRPAGLG